jgi:hypothetical protein
MPPEIAVKTFDGLVQAVSADLSNRKIEDVSEADQNEAIHMVSSALERMVCEHPQTLDDRSLVGSTSFLSAKPHG